MRPPRTVMMDSTEAAIGRLMKNFENTVAPHFCLTDSRRCVGGAKLPPLRGTGACTLALSEAAGMARRRRNSVGGHKIIIRAWSRAPLVQRTKCEANRRVSPRLSIV